MTTRPQRCTGTPGRGVRSFPKDWVCSDSWTRSAIPLPLGLSFNPPKNLDVKPTFSFLSLVPEDRGFRPRDLSYHRVDFSGHGVPHPVGVVVEGNNEVRAGTGDPGVPPPLLVSYLGESRSFETTLVVLFSK